MTNQLASNQRVLEEAIDIFNQVKSKIDGLIDCSVKDFEILNANFKNYFNNLQNLSDISNRFISFILDVNQQKALLELSDPEIFDKEKVFRRINTYIEQLKAIHKDFNFYLLIYSNLKQDLSTIRLLFTNLRFDPLVSTDYSKINELLNSIGNCYENQEKQINAICSSLSEIIKFTEEGIYTGIELFGNQIDKIREALMHIINLSYSAKKQKVLLLELEKKKIANTSEIITNLQFQDILRQQIEHVQEAHEEIIGNLKTSHQGGELLSEEELYKIRDINTLQSAQLIHANQEYQKAVETILHKINELNTLLNNYQSIWNHFCKPESAKFSLLKSQLTEQTTLILSQSFSLNHVYDKFVSLTEKAEKDYRNSFLSPSKKGNPCVELSLLREIIDTLSRDLFLNKKKYNPISQINGEIDKLESGYSKLSKSLKIYGLDRGLSEPFPRVEMKQDIDLIKSFTTQITNFYNVFLNEQIDNFNTKIQIYELTNFSVKDVAYYKTFEKEVREIITLLDNLLLNIRINKKEIDVGRLEHLKQHYTMESEREVHLIVSGKHKNPKKGKNKSKNNDVEFF